MSLFDLDRDEFIQVQAAGLEPLKTSKPLRLSEWAGLNFYLSAESSYVEGRWQAYPYQVAILDCIGNDDIREVTFIKSARVGYTKMLLAAIGYFAEHKRRNQAVWQPTDDDAEDFVKTELDTMLRDVPIMRHIFPSYMQRHRDNTLRQKIFLGSTIFLRGGKAAKNYRRLSVDVAMLDELDGFDNDVEKEGSPVNLAGKRVEGATFPKIITGNTPKIKGFSLVEARAQQAKLRFMFYIPCPHCGHEQALQWGGPDKDYGIKFYNHDPETATYLCGTCAAHFSQADYLSVWQRGRWMAEGGVWLDGSGHFKDAAGVRIQAPHHVAFHVWTAYSPQASWVQIVREFLSAKSKEKTGDKSELKTFINTTLGETWEEEFERTDENELMKRAEPYALRSVPMGGLVLVAGVDVQGDRFEIVVWAIGRGEEMWAIDYIVIHVSPADEREWDKLDDYLQTTFTHASGQTVRIEAAAVDTGGHFTHQAYNFSRRPRPHGKCRIFAIKGESRPGAPVKKNGTLQDVNYKGKTIKRGVKLWLVGTDTAKDLLHGRLAVVEPGPGYVHFSNKLEADFYKQLTAESRVPVRTNGGDQFRWMKKNGARNEVLDCTVYAIFCAHALDLHKFTDKMWGSLESAIQPNMHDLFADAGKVIEVQPSVPVTIDPATAPQVSTLQVSTPHVSHSRHDELMERLRSRGR